MQIIIHRVNTIERLKRIPIEFGVEIDVRGYGNRLLLNHDPIDDPQKYCDLEEYLKCYRHSFLIFNLKETGYEKTVIQLAKKYGINEYFLLDVEFPYLYRATRVEGFRKIAVRYSEAEPIEMAMAQVADNRSLLDWVWIDTNTKLPLDKETVEKLKTFRTCLVCPERWGRPGDIVEYQKKMKQLSFEPDAVMTSFDCADLWQNQDNRYE